MRRGFCSRCGQATDDDERFVVRVLVHRRRKTGSQPTRHHAQVTVCESCAEDVFNDAAEAITAALQKGK